jgi:hypothetical protein
MRGNYLPGISMKLLTKSARAKVEIGDAWVLVRIIPYREMIEMRDQCEITGQPKEGDEDARDFDQQEFAKRIFVAAVVDWGKFQDINGKAIPCTDENKADIYEMNINFVNEITEKASKIFAAVRERDEKNSPPGVNGTSPQEEPPVKSAGK